MANQREQLTRAIAAFKVKDYETARTLLQGIDHPRARELIAKIDERLTPAPQPPPKLKPPARQAPPPKSKRPPRPPAPVSPALLVVLVLVIATAGVMVLTRPTAPLPLPASPTIAPSPTFDVDAPLLVSVKADALALACQQTFDDQRTRMASSLFEEGCLREGYRLAQAYQDGTDFCYDHHRQSLALFMACLGRRQVVYNFDTLVNPTSVPVIVSSTTVYTSGSSTSASNARRPRNCTQAVAWGLSESQAAAWSHLDRDGDGKACYGD